MPLINTYIKDLNSQKFPTVHQLPAIAFHHTNSNMMKPIPYRQNTAVHSIFGATTTAKPLTPLGSL